MDEPLTVHRSRPRSNFTVLPNEAGQNLALSLRARGLLWELLTRPDDWRLSADELARHEIEGRDQIRAALRELKSAGYAVMTTERDEHGRVRSRWAIYDVPQPPTGRETSRVRSDLGELAFPQVLPDAEIPAGGGPAPFKRTEDKELTHKENTGASRRAVAAPPAVSHEWIGKVVEEIIGDLQATPAEAMTIAAMIDRGEHPRAVRYKIACDRWGIRSSRRIAEVVCIRHGLPFAADGVCGKGCDRSA